MKKTLTWQEFHEKAADFEGKRVVVRTKGMKGGAQIGKILGVRYARAREAFLFIVEVGNEPSPHIVDTDQSPLWVTHRSYPIELEDGSIEVHFENGVMLIRPDLHNPDEIAMSV